MTQRLRSLRQAVWAGDSTDPKQVGEALRDLYSWLSKVRIPDVVEVTNGLWASPFSVPVVTRPRIAILADARIAGTLQAVATSGGEWQTESDNKRISFTGINGLTNGTAYDLKFLVVY